MYSKVLGGYSLTGTSTPPPLSSIGVHSTERGTEPRSGPGPHQSANSDPDPDPHQSEMGDPDLVSDPHQSDVAL